MKYNRISRLSTTTVKLFLMLLLVALTHSNLAQQPGWNIIIHAPAGYELYLEDLWWLDIMNQEQEPMEIILSGEVIEGQQGLMFHGRSNSILVPPGGRNITPSDVVKIVDKQFNEEFKDAIERSGRFPAGNYNLCITVIAALTGQELGVNCMPHTVTMPSAPRLILPAEGDEVTELYPIFQWSEPSPLPFESRPFYRLKIFEVYRGQTPADAMDNIAHFEIDHLETNSLVYPLEALRLEDGKHYIWQIQAMDERGVSIGENEGKSEIWSFKYKTQFIPELVKVLAPSPDTLVIGGFRLVVDKESVSVSEQRLSGKATGQFLTPAPCASEDAATSGLDVDAGGQILIPGPQIYSANDFEVEFKDIKTKNWPPQKVEKVIQGSISQSFQPPIQLTIDDFTVNVIKLYLEGDSAYAALQIVPPADALGKANTCVLPYFEAKDVAINKFAQFHFTDSAFSADSLIIGNTGIWISVRGLEADFKKTPMTVTFDAGKTIPQQLKYANNSAFLYAEYIFTGAQVVSCEGFNAELTLKNKWDYETLIPLDFSVRLNSGKLTIKKSWIEDGYFTTKVDLPQSVKDQKKSPITLSFDRMNVDTLLNISGKMAFNQDEKICWGGFAVAADSGSLFFPGALNEFALTPLDTSADTTYNALDHNSVTADLATLPGLTIDLFRLSPLDTFIINSPDTKVPLLLNNKKINLIGWLNISTKGITGHLKTKEVGKLLDTHFGLPEKKGYKSDSSFAATLWHQPDSLFWQEFKFVRNAVYDSYTGGYLTIPYPCAIKPKFKDLEVTSTAELVGGDVFFSEKELAYWGVKMTSQNSGNVISADLGEIVYMNSSIAEKIHFSQSFKIVWGEMLADGGLGKFIFDLGSPQTFDGFNLTLHAAGLSKYNAKKNSATADTLGYLRAYGDLHFDFFGAHKMDVHDYKDARTGHDEETAPYYGHYVTLNKKNCELDFNKKWGSTTAQMIFTIDYDNIEKSGHAIGDQNGFRDDKTTTNLVHFWLTPSTGKQTLIPDDIDLNSVSSFFYFCKAGDLNMMSTGAQVSEISGLIQIKGDALKRIYFEGLSNVKGWYFQSDARASLEITPTNATYAFRGSICLMVVKCGLMGMVNTRFYVDKKNNSLEGDLSGILKAYAGGSNLLIAKTADYLGIEAKGRLNFYVSPDTNYVQGYAKVALEWGVTVECEGAFFVGINAPTSKIWALDMITKGPSIRERLEQNFKSLTGFYCAGLFTYGYDYSIFQLEFSLYAGFGFFYGDGNVSMVGHGGVDVKASILEGVVSAEAWAELYGDIVVGNTFDLCIASTVGLKACVMSAICPIDFDLTFHFNTEGFGFGGC